MATTKPRIVIYRSQGSFDLKRVGKTDREIAAILGVTPALVGCYMIGSKRPGPQIRAKIHTTFGIPVAAWDQPISTRSKPSTATPSTPPTKLPSWVGPASSTNEPGGAMSMARRLEVEIQDQLTRLGNDPTATPEEKSKITNKLAASILILARMTNQLNSGLALTRAPMWKELENVMFEALKPFPVAAKAVAEALERHEASFLNGHAS